MSLYVCLHCCEVAQDYYGSCRDCGAEVTVDRVVVPGDMAVDDVTAAALELSLPNINKLRAALWKRSKELDAQARHDMARLAESDGVES